MIIDIIYDGTKIYDHRNKKNITARIGKIYTQNEMAGKPISKPTVIQPLTEHNKLLLFPT